jgi:hypothetical protein
MTELSPRDPNHVERIVGAWGQMGTLVDDLLFDSYNDEGRFAAPLPMSSYEVAEATHDLGVDDLLLTPGDEFSDSNFCDWYDYCPDEPDLLWTLGKMGLQHTFSLRVPAEPTLVHLIGSSMSVHRNWAHERYMGLAMHYEDRGRMAEQAIGLIARSSGLVEAIRVVRIKVAGYGQKTIEDTRESAPWQTRMFVGRMREIIYSPYFQP